MRLAASFSMASATYRRARQFACCLAAVALACIACAALADPASGGSVALVRESAPPAAAINLPFRDFYRMPVGPRGLEFTDRLRAAHGQRVRLLGYVVTQESPSPGMFLLSPVPVRLSEQADGPADDLPVAVVFVHSDVLAPAGTLVAVTGRLSVGRQEEADGRVSWVRLVREPDQTAR